MYTQSLIIKNGTITNNAEILGKFKEMNAEQVKIKECIIC